MDRLHEECGIVGVFGDPEASRLVYLALHALQHRGQEACGIVTVSAGELHCHKAFGLVADSIDRDVLENLPGQCGVGHVRYSTQGGRLPQNIQPLSFTSSVFGPLAVSHNGNLTNARQLRLSLEEAGSVFQSTSDTEVILHLLMRSRAPDLRQRIADVMTQVRGAYSLVVLTEDRMFVVRDPHGFRPLALGERGKVVIAASETCALDLLDAKFLREVEPGEVVEVSDSGMKTWRPVPAGQPAFCAFEPIYFSRPDSIVFGDEVYAARRRLGAVLAREAPVAADLVIAVPDSGVPMAVGYAAEARLPFELGLIRNHYVGRTFIEPTQAIRDFGVKLKLNPLPAYLSGKRVVVVDDSIVRGTTSAKIVRLLQRAGASEIHLRVASPPITHSCYFGVDTPERKDLLAAQMYVEDIRRMVGCDSLAFLSRAGLKEALGPKMRDMCCYACFGETYPEEIFVEVASQPTDDKGPGYQALGR